ncbi:MAG: hypothetical protein J6T37_00895 [Bacteroidales bacterium]|nr:hypothetical protein [Bacteroidales bacterium]
MDDIINIFGTIFIAITAVATWITARTARSSLKIATSSQSDERTNRLLDVLAEIREIINDEKLSQSIDYIHSSKYNDDLERVRAVLGRYDINDIGLGDFETILNLFKNSLFLNKNNVKRKDIGIIRERLRKSYKKIQYLLDNMNRLGYLAEDENHRKCIVNYFDTITTIDIEKTYERLYSLIKNTRKELKSDKKYIHFTNLYNYVKKSNS